ncbi:hypothetical protein TNCV_3042631 [Trichonephila clavipes]|nr:hypothetical protein TNCV_3042631 [Trichonephila clavipes]
MYARKLKSGKPSNSRKVARTARLLNRPEDDVNPPEGDLPIREVHDNEPLVGNEELGIEDGNFGMNAVNIQPVLEEEIMDVDGAEPILEDNPGAEPILEDNPAAEPILEDNPAADPILEDNPAADPILEDNPAADPILEDNPAADPILRIIPDADPILEDNAAADPILEDNPGADPILEDNSGADPVIVDNYMEPADGKKEEFYPNKNMHVNG